jgi:hypothetical protein
LSRYGFSRRDLEMLETIEKLILEDRWCEMTAIKLRISPVTVRTRLYRLRLRFEKSEAFNKAYKQWREKLFRKSGGKWRQL